MLRLFRHSLWIGAVALLIGCSGDPEPKKDEPAPAGELKPSPGVRASDAPPLGGPREALVPDELLDGVEGSDDQPED